MNRSWKLLVVASIGAVPGAASAVAIPYSVSALNAYATFPASDEAVLLAATATEGGAPAAQGTVSFAVMQDATQIGTTVSGDVSNGTGSALFIVPQGTAPGSYTIQATYEDVGATSPDATDSTHTLMVAQAPALVRTEVIAAGASSCAAGGVEVDSGLDNGANGGIALDGILETGEVLATSDVCDGANGMSGTNGTSAYQALVESAALPVGNSICPEGGTQVDVGIDNGAGGGTAGDGILQPGEITSTVDICNGANGTNGTNGTNGANGKSGCASVPVGALALLGALVRRRRR